MTCENLVQAQYAIARLRRRPNFNPGFAKREYGRPRREMHPKGRAWAMARL